MNAPILHAAGREEDLGSPVTGVTSGSAGFTTNAAGRGIGLVTAVGQPAVFSAVDLLTGERLLSHEIESNGAQVWGYATTPDRAVYFATTKTGEVFRFDPDKVTISKIADHPYGQSHIFCATPTPDGHVVFGSYPDGKVITFDPGPGRWRDYGTVVDGAMYVRSVDADQHHIYAGTGTVARLVRVDRASGDVDDIELPPGNRDNQRFVHDVGVRDGRLFARPEAAGRLLTYSFDDREWEVGSPSVEPVEATPGSFATGQDDPPTIFGGRRTSPILEIRDGDHDRRVIVTAGHDARLRIRDLDTDWTREVAADAAPARFFIRSLAIGPRGDIWVGGYASPPGLGRIDPDTGHSELLPGRGGQPESLVTFGKRLVYGTYPKARLYSYDTTIPWKFGTNPGSGVPIGHSQDRPLAMAAAGERVAVGTMPDYGQLGGALTLFDPLSGEVEVHRHVVPDQTVLALTHRGGLVYGGTGIWGGIGIEPSTTEGHLFVFDPSAEEVVHAQVPVAGAQNVSALTFDDSGQLWGLTANELFRFDLRTRTVTGSRRYFDVDDSRIYATGRELLWHRGRLVGTTADRVFTIDPVTWELTVLATDAHNLAIDRHGILHYSRGARLHRLRL